MGDEAVDLMTMRRAPAWAAVALLVLTAFALVFVPAWIVQPFKPESQSGLQLAYGIKRISPIVTALALLGTLVLGVALWRSSRRWWSRTLIVFALLFATGFAWLARQNHFEWMFHPLPAATWAKAADATFVDDSDMVLAVMENGEAVAYPIRQMGYHHVVHDVVGGIPIVVTY